MFSCLHRVFHLPIYVEALCLICFWRMKNIVNICSEVKHLSGNMVTHQVDSPAGQYNPLHLTTRHNLLGFPCSSKTFDTAQKLLSLTD